MRRKGEEDNRDRDETKEKCLEVKEENKTSIAILLLM